MSKAGKKLKNVCRGNGFALSLVLKQRLIATPKWPIGLERFHFISGKCCHRCIWSKNASIAQAFHRLLQHSKKYRYAF